MDVITTELMIKGVFVLELLLDLVLLKNLNII